MGSLAQIAEKIDLPAAFVRVSESDSIATSITITGSFDDRNLWKNGILHNSRYFIVQISTPNGKAYQGGDVVLEGLAGVKIRKFTGSPDKALARLLSWCQQNQGHEHVAS